MRVWLAENEFIIHVTRVKVVRQMEFTNGARAAKILSALTFCDAYFI